MVGVGCGAGVGTAGVVVVGAGVGVGCVPILPEDCFRRATDGMNSGTFGLRFSDSDVVGVLVTGGTTGTAGTIEGTLMMAG